MRREEKKKSPIVLADGREVKNGPWCEFPSPYGSTFKNIIEVRILTDPLPTARSYDRQFPKSVAVLSVVVSTYPMGLRMPEITKLEGDLWNEDLLRAVVRAIETDNEIKPKLTGYILKKLAAPRKELPLGGKRVLVGGLEFENDNRDCRSGLEDIRIYGYIRDGEGGDPKRVKLLTVKGLCEQGSWLMPDQEPGYRRNTEVWCKVLESLLLKYLEEMASYAASPMNKQIWRVVSRLRSNTDWAKKCSRLLSGLRGLDPSMHDDERVREIFRLADGMGMLAST